jgi:hypothetical protein
MDTSEDDHIVYAISKNTLIFLDLVYKVMDSGIDRWVDIDDGSIVYIKHDIVELAIVSMRWVSNLTIVNDNVRNLITFIRLHLRDIDECERRSKAIMDLHGSVSGMVVLEKFDVKSEEFCRFALRIIKTRIRSLGQIPFYQKLDSPAKKQKVA